MRTLQVLATLSFLSTLDEAIPFALSAFDRLRALALAVQRRFVATVNSYCIITS